MNAQSILTHWQEVRQGLFAALDRVSDEQLDFSPAPGLWTMRQVLVHIANVEEAWFRLDVNREPADLGLGERRPEDYPTVASIKDLLTRVHEWTESFLSQDADAKLARKVETPEGDTDGAWVLLHVFEHEIHHRGEVFLMLGLLGMKAPAI